MDPQMEQELLDVVHQLESMADLRVVIITGGSPDVFIRHYDVAELHRRSQNMRERGLRFDPKRPVPPSPIHKLLALIAQSRLVYVAALNGTAMGGGFEIALGCDLRVVQDGDYLLGLPEINLGLLPGAGGTQRLSRLLGESRAMECLLLGRTLQPAEMVSLGLAQACVSDALSHAQALAEQITLRPARACAHIKALVRGAQDGPLSHGEALERTFFCDCMIDDDAQPLMDAVGSHERSIAQAPPPGR
jgi:enoyl-CoA hydratase/carnithine racemase